MGFGGSGFGDQGSGGTVQGWGLRFGVEQLGSGVWGRPSAPPSSPTDAESPYARKGRWGEGAAGEASCAFAARLFHGGVTTLPRLLRVAGCMVLAPVEWMVRNVSVRRCCWRERWVRASRPVAKVVAFGRPRAQALDAFAKNAHQSCQHAPFGGSQENPPPKKPLR